MKQLSIKNLFSSRNIAKILMVTVLFAGTGTVLSTTHIVNGDTQTVQAAKLTKQQKRWVKKYGVKLSKTTYTTTKSRKYGVHIYRWHHQPLFPVWNNDTKLPVYNINGKFLYHRDREQIGIFQSAYGYKYVNGKKYYLLDSIYDGQSSDMWNLTTPASLKKLGDPKDLVVLTANKTTPLYSVSDPKKITKWLHKGDTILFYNAIDHCEETGNTDLYYINYDYRSKRTSQVNSAYIKMDKDHKFDDYDKGGIFSGLESWITNENMHNGTLRFHKHSKDLKYPVFNYDDGFHF